MGPSGVARTTKGTGHSWGEERSADRTQRRGQMELCEHTEGSHKQSGPLGARYQATLGPEPYTGAPAVASTIA